MKKEYVFKPEVFTCSDTATLAVKIEKYVATMTRNNYKFETYEKINSEPSGDLIKFEIIFTFTKSQERR